MTVLTVLSHFQGPDDSEYLQGIRDDGGMAEEVRVQWTGTAVVSPEITAEGAQT